MSDCAVLIWKDVLIAYIFEHFTMWLKIVVPEGNLSWNGMSKTSAKFEMLHSCPVESVPVQGRKPLLVFLFNQGMCSKKPYGEWWGIVLHSIVLISDVLFLLLYYCMQV